MSVSGAPTAGGSCNKPVEEEVSTPGQVSLLLRRYAYAHTRIGAYIIRGIHIQIQTQAVDEHNARIMERVLGPWRLMNPSAHFLDPHL